MWLYLSLVYSLRIITTLSMPIHLVFLLECTTYSFECFTSVDHGRWQVCIMVLMQNRTSVCQGEELQ
jgi:hypothetical protein